MIDFDNIDLIVFDIDGTLAETDDYFVGKGSVIIRKIFPFISEERANKLIRPLVMAGETVIHFFYRILDLFGLDRSLSALHNRISADRGYRYEPVSGMKKTLEYLSGKYILAVLSSGGRKSTEAFIDKYELGNIIRFVVSAEDCKYIKPHPGALKYIAEKAGVPIERCLMVGDTIFDIICAKRAGAYCAAVRSGFDSNRFLKIHKADLILDSVSELPDWLNKSGSEFDNSMDKQKDLV